jgi:hypothetical protein
MTRRSIIRPEAEADITRAAIWYQPWTSLNSVANSQYRHAVASGLPWTSLNPVANSQYRHTVESGLPWTSLNSVANSKLTARQDVLEISSSSRRSESY